MSNRAPSSNPSSRSSRTSSPASGQPRTGSVVTASRPTTPGPGQGVHPHATGVTTSRPTTPSSGGQLRTGSNTTSRPTTPGPGGQPHGGAGGGGTASRPNTPASGGQPRRGAAPASRPTTPGPGAGSGNNAGLVSHFSSPSASSLSAGTGTPSPPRTTTLNTTATAIPIAINNADHLGGIRIKVESDTSPSTQTRIADGSPLFLAVAAAVNLGLKMLESTPGKHALTLLGEEVVNLWTDDGERHLFPVHPATYDNMTPYVTAYLKELRDNFVPILLTNNLNGEGEACKSNWGRPAEGRPAKGLNDYVGSKAGRLHLNKFIFETIVKASEKIQNGNTKYERTYELQMAMMGITVAHELCHFFIGYLVGYELPSTPPDFRYLRKDLKIIRGTLTGESGRWWEAGFFGGETRFFTEPLVNLDAPEKHPMGYDQAGDLWLLDGESTRISVIDRKSITGLLNFDFSPNTIPFRVVGAQENLMKIKRSRLRMDEMRNLALGKKKDYKPPKGAVTQEELDAHNLLRRRDFGGGDFKRLAMIPLKPKFLHKPIA